MASAERQQHLDPYQVHKENMQMLKVIPMVGNRSAPNSPMMRRANSTEKLGQKATFLTPSPQRKNILQVSDESRARSLTHLTTSPGNSPKNLSPGGSPVGSPMSVSERIIKTHFLSNTTGTPGSFLLRKSDELLKQKESPIGSPRIAASPNLERKTGSPAHRKGTWDVSQTIMLTVPAPAQIPVVISPATEDSKIGFENPLQCANKPEVKPANILHPEKRQPTNVQSGQSITESEEQEVEDIRHTIGLVLSKPKPFPNPPSKVGQGVNATQKEVIKKPTKERDVKAKPKRHHYIKYGNTNKSPGMLSPPMEPRQSKDLSAEMETWERKEKKLFNDLEHLEEFSNTGPSEDSTSSADGEESSDANKNHQKVFTMPHVYQNVSRQLEERDFSIPLDMKGEIDPKEWEQMKRCRYLRVERDSDGEIDDDLDDQEFSDDEEDESEKPTQAF